VLRIELSSLRGFRELYEKIPNPKPEFEDIWRMAGGNPDMLSKLYQANWSVEDVVSKLIEDKEIIPSFIEMWRKHLETAVEDPDTLWSTDTSEELIRELTARNSSYTICIGGGWSAESMNHRRGGI